MADTIESLQRKVAELESRMGIGQDDPVKDGYLVLVRLLHEQNSYLNKISIKTLMTASEEKGKASEYERAKGLWEKLPSMIQQVSALRMDLKMDGNDNKKLELRPVSAATITDTEEEDD
jgi:hypothetical protein